MKKRVDEIQTFHNSTRVTSGATQNQYQILNVLREPSGTVQPPPTQNIQYTYTPSAITATNIQKNNVTQQQPPQNQTVHVVNASGLNMSNTVRNKPPSSGSITPTPLTITSPGGNTVPAQNVSGQNFPRLKVEDALSYLDQVS